MNPTLRIPIIIDTDPGLDDAIAILLALASPELELLGLTTVAGNLPIEVTTQNALRLAELAGRPDIPVFRGEAGPLAREPLHCGDIHGPDGLGDGLLPPARGRARDSSAVDWLAETLRAAPAGTVTICALGPLTNIAKLLARAPDLAPRLRRIVAMGGALRELGNMTPHAEFNMLADPDAAAEVVSSGVPMTLVPLDVTRRVRATRDWIEALRSDGGRVAGMAADLLYAYFGGKGQTAGDASRPLHDPCVVACLLQPALFGSEAVPLRIEATDPETLGRCIEGDGTGSRKVDVLTSVAPDLVLDLLKDRLSGLG